MSERVCDFKKVRDERREDLQDGRMRQCSQRCGSSERRGREKEGKDMPDARRALNAILEAIVVVGRRCELALPANPEAQLSEKFSRIVNSLGIDHSIVNIQYI